MSEETIIGPGPTCVECGEDYGLHARYCSKNAIPWLPDVPSFTLEEVMSALSDAFPSPRTSRDCVVEKNLRDILAHRAVRLISSSSEAERTAAPVVQR